MKRVIKLALLAIVGGAIVLFGAFWVSPALQDKALELAARSQLLRTADLPLDDNALRVVLCGTSSPMPLRGAAKSCTLVIAGGRLFLVDIGPEASENLVVWRVPLTRIETVFLTHFHSDHIGELAEFNMQGWVQGRRKPLVVYGPEGVEQVVAGFNAAYALDSSYRHAHHDKGKGLLPLAASTMQSQTITLGDPGAAPAGRSAVVYELDGLRITAIEVDHRPVVPALAYRFDYRGRSVVISGDTNYYPPLAAAARAADVLISEGESHHMQNLIAAQAEALGARTLAGVLRDTTSYHISPLQAARLANEAGVRELVFTHIAPPLINKALEIPWLRGVDAIRPEGVRIGHDGMLITIPLNGGTIKFGRLQG